MAVRTDRPVAKPSTKIGMPFASMVNAAPLVILTVQEFLFPLLIDELNTDKPAGNSHWDD
jgi:hypothetical protein